MNHSSYSKFPEITVLMSCYNATRWLHEAIDSVLEQSFGNFEFIIVDDGSNDGSLNIIKEYQIRDKRIIPVPKENSGLMNSLNVGIAKAKGRWIARIDADDLCEPTRLEEQVSFMRLHPEVTLLGTGNIEIDSCGRIITQHRYPISHKKLISNLIHNKKFFSHSSICYPTDIVKSIGGYNTRLPQSEDRRLYFDLAYLGNIACIQKCLVRQRKHSAQMTHEKSGHRQIYYSVAISVCHYLRTAGSKDPLTDFSEEEWIFFLNWIKRRINHTDLFKIIKTWSIGRDLYFSENRKLTGCYRFASHLLCSGYASQVLWKKLNGFSLPKKLAKEWTNRACKT